MSTFGGIMPEFPDIRVDYFRKIPERRQPLACFLSHVHSDHLAGLESLKSPFIYCSAATRELLLHMERYPHRLNFALGILESRKLHYKHLKNLLKAIPLETPTCVELEPGNEIQVTLFDANHCTGAVMFLFEGNGKAVLYTGDTRSEPWFVNSLTRSPFLIEYALGLRTLDCIYLDTSNTNPVEFPTKAEGLKELLKKVVSYPPDTVFHFTAWTFGYEEVWMTLSRALNSPIHVDAYKMRLYQSLRGESLDKILAHEGPVLTGYQCGNTPQAGCLTRNHAVRLHSCEKGMYCSSLNERTVWIRPIITRTSAGVEVAEIGVGGGGGDLTQRPELEIDNDYAIDQLLGLFANTEDLVINDVKRVLLEGLRSTRRGISLEDMGLQCDEDDLTLTQLTKVLAQAMTEKRTALKNNAKSEMFDEVPQPRVITFPYSRHSSYAELCHLVKEFNPKDVYPCTVDEDKWHEGISMKVLFGSRCSSSNFRHDSEMRILHADRHPKESISEETQSSETRPSQMLPPTSPLQRRTPQRTSLATPIRREVQGPMGPFNGLGNEVSRPLQEEGTPSIPPKEIISISPGSESQNLRRKVILDGLSDGPVKRARLHLESSASSSPLQLEDRNPGNTFAVTPIPISSDASSPVNTPGSVDDTSGDDMYTGRRPPSPSLAGFLKGNGREIVHDDDAIHWDPNAVDQNVFFDCQDQIMRCKLCGHELWTSIVGFCSGCEQGQSGIPYFEIINHEAGARPEIVANEYVPPVKFESRRDIVGDYLDDHSSAYDSQDEKGTDFEEKYEIDSFIDDESQCTSDNESSSSSDDDEIDYKAKYENLLLAFDNLIADYCDLEQDHASLKWSIFGSEGEDTYNSDDEVDEDGALIIDASGPDPVVAELVLSQAGGQSQSSEITEGRVSHRIQAYEAARDEDGSGWHNISMVSTGANHTHEEVEL